MYKDKTNYEHLIASGSFIRVSILMTPYLPIFPWIFYGLDENHPIFSPENY